MIKRFLSEQNLCRLEKDFTFLIKMIHKSYGEYDLNLRDEYFNIYYKGNSLAKVLFKNKDIYQIDIHQKFFLNTSLHNSIYYRSIKQNGNYLSVTLESNMLHRFLQKKHLSQLSSKIKSVNSGEEIEFEQALITDNMNRKKVIFIDRQINDNNLKGKRLDLLALRQFDGNKYNLLVSEVKLGNNKELKDKVATQLNEYVSHISENFESYKNCYEAQYKQKKHLGLFNIPEYECIKIIKPIKGIIIVGGYSGIAEKQIYELKGKYPEIEVKQFKYEL